VTPYARHVNFTPKAVTFSAVFEQAQTLHSPNSSYLTSHHQHKYHHAEIPQAQHLPPRCPSPRNQRYGTSQPPSIPSPSQHSTALNPTDPTRTPQSRPSRHPRSRETQWPPRQSPQANLHRTSSAIKIYIYIPNFLPSQKPPQKQSKLITSLGGAKHIVRQLPQGNREYESQTAGGACRDA
jgi:hypothetical protein